MLKKGSIISVTFSSSIDIGTKQIKTDIHTISVVDKIIEDKVYCKYSICSIDGKPFVDTKEIIKDYKYEFLNSVQLINGDEFNIVFDTNIIPKSELKNLKF